MPGHHAQHCHESDLAPGPTPAALDTGCSTASVSVIDLTSVPIPSQPEAVDMIDLIEDSEPTDWSEHGEGPTNPASRAELATKPRKWPRIDINNGQGQPADIGTSSILPDQLSAAVSAQPHALMQHKPQVAGQEPAMTQQDQNPLPAPTPPKSLHRTDFELEIVEVVAHEQQPDSKQATPCNQSTDLRRRNALLTQELDKLQVCRSALILKLSALLILHGIIPVSSSTMCLVKKSW